MSNIKPLDAVSGTVLFDRCGYAVAVIWRTYNAQWRTKEFTGRANLFATRELAIEYITDNYGHT